MNPTEEFRAEVQKLLSEVQSLLQADCVRLYPMEYNEQWENEVTVLIWDQVVRTGLLDKTPVRPAKLQDIKKEICGLYLVKVIELEPPPCNPFDPKFDHATIARDLQVLEFRLREILEVLESTPESTLSREIPAAPHGKRGPQPDMALHRKIAGIVEPYGQGWRQESNLIRIAAELDQASVSVKKSWKEQRVRTWNRAVTSCREKMIKAIRYSLWMAHRNH